jgi:hypothetical protein
MLRYGEIEQEMSLLLGINGLPEIFLSLLHEMVGCFGTRYVEPRHILLPALVGPLASSVKNPRTVYE